MAVALAHTTNIPIRQDHNEVIRILASLYPKTFFAEPKQRRPLKLNIVADLSKADDAELADYNVGTAIDWYISHIGYDHSCIAGAKRLNLDGKEVSRVTESEARDALAYLCC
jgi:sRNA-binding protein